jgi:beta-galactosidase
MTNGAAPGMRPVQVGDGAVRVGGGVRELYGAAVHYWRLDRDKWDGILQTVRDMGYTMISIYMPWEVHEIERGRFDFGEIDPRKDLGAFLTLIESKGMDIIARPGPQINSELTGFGYPGRILADPELHALNGQGSRAVLTQVPQPIPALAYASEKFLAEVTTWYDAILPILAKHAYPKGRLVAAQVDNEMAYFFCVNAYASDFSPSAIARYRLFLQELHGDIGSLNAVYGTSYGSFDELDPPRRFEARTRMDIPYHVDWIAYRERHLVDAMGRLADMMRERGLQDVALFHNYPHPLDPGGAASGFTTPFSIQGLEEKLDWVGFDVYSRKELYEHVKTVISYMVGTSRFPYIPEFIAGVWPWYLNPGDIRDEEFVTKAGLMNGVKGFSRYTLVERDRWLDSPVRRDGRVRPDHVAVFRRANEVALQHRFVDLRRAADVVLLANREYDRLEAASVLVSFPGDFLETPSGFSEYPSFMTVSEATLGFEEPIQMAKSDWFSGCFHGLSVGGTAFLLSDTALAPERWRRFRVIVLSTYEYLDSTLQAELVRFAGEGGIVVVGPRIPQLDSFMRPCDTLGAAFAASAGVPLDGSDGPAGTVYPVGQGRIVHVERVEDAARAVEIISAELDLVRFTKSDPRLDVTVHRNLDMPGRFVFFVANPTDQAIDAEVGLSIGLGTVTEIWEERPVTVGAGVIQEHMDPYSIKIYESLQ